jgi:nitrite reductase/ring-hydroxylating ferredoxin subunit
VSAGQAEATTTLDVERVVCRLTELEAYGARAFTIGGGDWPLRGFVVRAGATLYAYVNRCPHAGHPLNLLPGRFLTPDGALVLCSSHGALFEKQTGLCVAGPCAGRSLTPVPLEIRSGFVMLADGADVAALAAVADGSASGVPAS